MAELDDTKQYELKDGGGIKFVTRGRYVHMEVTDNTGRTSMVRLEHSEARKLVPTLKIGATKAELTHRRICPSEFIRLDSE